MPNYPFNDNVKTTTIRIREEELAATVNTRPVFGIDIAAVGTDDEKKIIAPAVPGTFYDLISPDYSKEEERAYIKARKEAEKKARQSTGDLLGGGDENAKEKATRVGGGDPRYSFTFKALHTEVQNKMLAAVYQSLPSDFRVSKVPEVKDEAVNAYFASGGMFTLMYSYIRVKKVGSDFIVTLPIARLSPMALLDECTQGIPYTGHSYEEKKQAAVPGLVKSLKQHGFPIDANKWMFEIPRDKVSRALTGRYSRVNAFYSKYVVGYSAYDIKQVDVASRPPEDLTEDLDAAAAFRRNYIVCAVLKLPAKEAEYYVQTPAERITPAALLTFFSNWYNKGVRGNDGFPTFIHSLNTILTKNASYTPKPRVDKEGLALTKTNHLMYIPSNVNLIKEYNDLIELLTKDSTGEATFAHTSLTKMPINKLIYVDWINQKLIFTGSYAQIKVEDIESNHVMPVSSYVGWYQTSVVEQIDDLPALERLGEKISAALDRPIPKTTADFQPMLGEGYYNLIATFLQRINPAAYARSFGTSAFRIDNCRVIDYIKGISTFLSLANVEMARHTAQDLDQGYLDFLGCYPLMMKDLFSKQMTPFAPVQAYMEALATAVPHEEDWLNIINECKAPAHETLGQIALFKIIQSFSRMPEILREYEAINKPYLTQDVGIESFIPKLKNAEGLEGLKPHQRKVAGVLAKHPKFAIVAVQAGGGKTILCLQDILNCLEHGVVKKPLILCPAHLVKDYVGEAIYVSHGKLNTIVFDTAIFRAYSSVAVDGKRQSGQSDFGQLKVLCDNAPINTIYIIGYDNVKSVKPQTTVYGTLTEDYQEKLEFLRSLGFDGVWMDESHKLKNMNSQRAQVIESLISEIPIKRILTGTIVPNTLYDLVEQVGMMAPNILGNEEQFRDRFFLYIEGKGKRGGKWVPKPGAEREIRDFIKRSCAYINIQRKEWQASLPDLNEILVPLDMTEAQWEIYNILIQRAVDEMESRVRGGKLEVSEDGEDDDDAEVINVEDVMEDNEDDEALERMFSAGGLGKNLAAVEGFLSNPVSVAEGNDRLTGDDRISPKAKACVEILRKHLTPRAWANNTIKERTNQIGRGSFANEEDRAFAQQDLEDAQSMIYRLDNPDSQEAKDDPVFPGKILIFCNTDAAVNGIVSAIKSADGGKFRDSVLRYEAAMKSDHEYLFKNDDKIRVLVGIRNSLEEGLNLQMADTLIRADNVWTPGSSEQGMSRINRPNFKGTDFRKKIYVYNLMVDRTIDVLKTARLTSKTVSVSKFYAAGTVDENKYAQIGLDSDGEQIPPVKISFANMRKGLSLSEMNPYWYAYQQLRTVEGDIAREWKAAQPLGSLEDIPVVHTGIIPGSKRLKRVPYVAGMSIFNADKLGLRPYTGYKREQEEKFTKKQKEAGEEFDPIGLSVHTAFGDGKIGGVRKTGSLRVDFDNGSNIVVRPSATFVITKKTTSTLELLDQIARQTGLDIVDVQLRHWKEGPAPVEKPTLKTLKQIRDEKRDQDKGPRKDDPRKVVRDATEDQNEIFQDTADRAAKEIVVRVARINDMLAVVIPSNDAAADVSQFKEDGFMVTPLYSFVQVKNPKQLNGFIEEMVKAQNRSNSGVEFKPSDIDMWENVLKEYKTNKQFIVKPNTFSNIKNFLLERRRPVQSGMVRPMPLVKNHQLYICLDLLKHSQSTSAMKKVQMMATKVGLGAWKPEQPDMIAFCTNKAEVKSKVKSLQRAGWTVTNADEFLEDLDALIARGKTPSGKDSQTTKPKTTLKIKPKVTRKGEKVKPKTTLKKVMKARGKK